MLTLSVWIAFVALIIAVALARWSALRLRDETSRRLPVGDNGLITGAEGFELRRGADAPAILLVHGGGDTPQTLRYLAEHLYACGYSVRVPLLPGHGRTLRAFSDVVADQWIQTVRSAYRELGQLHSWVAVGGLSMGGALTAQLAAEQHSIPATVLLAPYLAIPGRISVVARFARLWGFALPYVRALDPTAPRSIRNEAEAQRSLAYGVFTPAALRALRITVVRAIRSLSAIESPTLMVQSRDDNRIAPNAAQSAFERIAARDKKLIWVTGAGHVITVDDGREHVFALVTDWLDRHRATVVRELRA
jgi:carboxylesterase